MEREKKSGAQERVNLVRLLGPAEQEKKSGAQEEAKRVRLLGPVEQEEKPRGTGKAGQWKYQGTEMNFDSKR